MKETSMCRQMLMWASELDWNLRWSCDSTLSPQEIDFTSRNQENIAIFVVFLHRDFAVFYTYLLKNLFFALLRLKLFLCLQLRALTKRYPVPGEDWKALYEAFTLLKFEGYPNWPCLKEVTFTKQP